MIKYKVLHIISYKGKIRVETPASKRALRIIPPLIGPESSVGLAFAAMLGLIWAIPHAETVYLHRKDGTVEYEIIVKHIGGKRII